MYNIGDEGRLDGGFPLKPTRPDRNPLGNIQPFGEHDSNETLQYVISGWRDKANACMDMLETENQELGRQIQQQRDHIIRLKELMDEYYDSTVAYTAHIAKLKSALATIRDMPKGSANWQTVGSYAARILGEQQ